MKGKIPAFAVPLTIIFCWLMDSLPFFIPAMNTIEPKILGLPFVVVWQGLWIVIVLGICIFATANIWDNFDANGEEDEEVEK